MKERGRLVRKISQNGITFCRCAFRQKKLQADTVRKTVARQDEKWLALKMKLRNLVLPLN